MNGPDVTEIVIAGGRRLRARRWAGHGRPLVLLHGFLDSSEGWASLASDTHRPCVAFDLPGFGGSDRPREALMTSYAEDIVAGLDQLAISDCTLVGHSLGGAIAVAVAELSPAVHSLALLAPAGFGAIRLADAFALPGVHALAMRALPLALATPPVVLAAYMAMISNHRLPPRDLLNRVRAGAWTAGPGAGAAVQALARAGHAPNAFHRRRLDFEGPVAALWGERDALVPLEHIAGLRSALPQVHVEVWRGMGHHPQRERPIELAHFIELRASRARRAQRRRRAAQQIVPAAAAA
jgi:pyruvate dehydrogenase E2 component (dihydrolipoamide acetyltransferase)